MWLKKVLAELSLALVISLSQCTGACWEFALEPIKLPFILSGVCSPSEANYCSNPFEVFYIKITTKLGTQKCPPANLNLLPDFGSLKTVSLVFKTSMAKVEIIYKRSSLTNIKQSSLASDKLCFIK